MCCKGSYTCEIFPGSMSGPQISIIESFVTIWATVDGADVYIEPVDIPFIPAIYVEDELSLSEITQSTELLIYGVPDLLKVVTVRVHFLYLLSSYIYLIYF